MISQNIISPICVEKGKRQSRQTAVNVKDGNERLIKWLTAVAPFSLHSGRFIYFETRVSRGRRVSN